MGWPAAMEVLLRRGVDTTNVVDSRQMSSGERFLVACFLGAAIWNAVGMFPMIFLTFKRLWTLYFWAMILSTAGILICSASQIISVATPQVNSMINGVMSCIGWVFMVTGQSVVLYSRLHLLAITPRVLRLVLCMIIVNGITIHITGTVLTVGTRLQPPTSIPFTEAYRSVSGGWRCQHICPLMHVDTRLNTAYSRESILRCSLHKKQSYRGCTSGSLATYSAAIRNPRQLRSPVSGNTRAQELAHRCGW